MKNLLSIAVVIVLVWGCAKKIAPVKSETPSSNIGTSNTNINADQPTTLPTTTSTAPTYKPDVPITGTSATTQSAIQSTPGTDPAIVAQRAGQLVYGAKCGSCHGFKVTTDYTASRWASIIAVEAIRAKLTDTEKENILAYVRANAKKG